MDQLTLWTRYVRGIGLARRMVEETGQYRSGDTHMRRCSGVGCKVISGRYDGGPANVFCSAECRETRSAPEGSPEAAVAVAKRNLARFQRNRNAGTPLGEIDRPRFEQLQLELLRAKRNLKAAK